MRSAEKVIVALALTGVLLGAYALLLHYDGGGKLCNLGESFDCDKVNKSVWSEILGIPVALLGLLAYAGIAFLVLQRRRIQGWLAFTDRDYWQYLFYLVLGMTLFQAYLTMTEVLFIGAFCIICLGSQAVMLALAVLVWREV